jgi:membrane protease subunit HflC
MLDSHTHHHHHHDDDIQADAPPGRRPPRAAARLTLARLTLACLVLVAAVLAACAIMVDAGTAVVVTQFGAPVRVLTTPGLAWKAPVPIQVAIPVDLRLRTTSTGLQDVGTRDGLRILMQAYIAWQVPPDPDAIRRFLRAARNDPDEAARQLRLYVGSALQVAASGFDLDQLVNTDPSRVMLTAFEDRLRQTVAAPTLATYGIAIRQIGLERLSLPDTTLAATVERMRAERETVAAQRTAEGLREAAAIRSDATRDSRIAVANARAQAAGIEAEARRRAAEIYGRAYAADPVLYTTLRQLDTLGAVVSGNTRLVLRTDTPPFDLLTHPPDAGPAAR